MNKIRKLLIANRGEIAGRVIKSCDKLGISTIAVYSSIDMDRPFVKMADEAVCIGETGIDTYLNVDAIILAAKKTGADAIHPGYGLLSENSAFASRCRSEGLIFIGPSPESISLMGSKIAARELCEKIGIPVIPGFKIDDGSEHDLLSKASAVGYPVMIKASAGGGGVGIFLVEEESQFINTMNLAKKKSMAMYGTDGLLVEKYLKSVKHIEFQILGDSHGNVIHCFERDCSVQRRHQKLFEEAPSVAINDVLRARMGDAAVSIAKAVDYTNAGTIEFVLCADGTYYFLEMNTRLQVEHTITEEITGLDLVRLQIAIAEGEKLGIAQGDLAINGHAVECRIYAEDPDNDFNPSAGNLLLWEVPPSLRTDSGVASGSKVTIDFDPMLAKIISHAGNRQDALRKMENGLANTVALGVATNLNFLSRLLKENELVNASVKTDFFEQKQAVTQRLELSGDDTAVFLIAAAVAKFENYDEGCRDVGWTGRRSNVKHINFMLEKQTYTLNLNSKEKHAYEIHIDNSSYNVTIHDRDMNCVDLDINGWRRKFRFAIDDEKIYIHSKNIGHRLVTYLSRFHSMEFHHQKKGNREAPMAGKVAGILVATGDRVEKGQELIIIESMKMEIVIHSDQAGSVKEILVKQGDSVNMGTLLFEIETES